ncbi:MAG: DUF2817 domain-containing protein [Proteobacteria bacterium]|nr:DUF2817 domain-containing protein [Pseudomonadota bacterium]
MSDATAFSPDYVAARARFRSAAHALHCSLEALPIGQRSPEGEELTIDVARLGSDKPEKVVIVSSGLHGVEGIFGSAVQAALLEDHLGGWKPPSKGALILIHALNPYGFAWTRRVNEENVDLNRNFLLNGEDYSGSPEMYWKLDELLNPTRPPGRISGFLPKAIFNIARFGMPALKNAVAGGQYDYPKGLFFGGSKGTTTKNLLKEHLPRWVGEPQEVLHIDFHSGLGKPTTYKLLVDHPWGSDRVAELGAIFGAKRVEPWEPDQGVSYNIRGGLGTWCQELFPNVKYDVLCAEFGTVHVLKVIAALHQENRAHNWGDPEAPGYKSAKQMMIRAFAPPESSWRNAVVPKGLRIVERAMDASFA